MYNIVIESLEKVVSEIHNGLIGLDSSSEPMNTSLFFQLLTFEPTYLRPNGMKKKVSIGNWIDALDNPT